MYCVRSWLNSYVNSPRPVKRFRIIYFSRRDSGVALYWLIVRVLKTRRYIRIGSITKERQHREPDPLIWHIFPFMLNRLSIEIAIWFSNFILSYCIVRGFWILFDIGSRLNVLSSIKRCDWQSDPIYINGRHLTRVLWTASFFIYIPFSFSSEIRYISRSRVNALVYKFLSSEFNVMWLCLCHSTTKLKNSLCSTCVTLPFVLCHIFHQFTTLLSYSFLTVTILRSYRRDSLSIILLIKNGITCYVMVEENVMLNVMDYIGLHLPFKGLAG